MNNTHILSASLKTLLILVLILIAVTILYYIINNYKFQTTETNPIEQYLSTLSNVDMPRVMLADIDKHDIINGTMGLHGLSRSYIIVNDKKLDESKIQQQLFQHCTYPVTKSEKAHFKYLKNLKLTIYSPMNCSEFRPRTLTATFLEDIFAQSKPLKKIFKRLSQDIIPQKNIIHELVTHANQEGYICFIRNIVSKIINPEGNEQSYALWNVTPHISIKVINSHTIKCKVKLEKLPIYEENAFDKPAIHHINTSLTFTMTSTPGNVYSYISYKDIKFKLDFPNAMKQLTKKTKTAKHMQLKVLRTALKNRNSLVYQLPDFISHGLLYTTYQDQGILDTDLIDQDSANPYKYVEPLQRRNYIVA